MKAVVLLSGGLDSTTLAYFVKEKRDVYALSFDYGQRHSKELISAKKTCKKLNIPHKIISLKDVFSGSALTGEFDVPKGHYKDKSMKITVVPNRNMVMLSMAISYAITIGAKEVYYGAHSGDHGIYPDCRPKFVLAMKNVAKICDYKPIDIMAPFLHKNKADIVRVGTALGVDYSLTWTCYEGLKDPCGKCGSCVERAEAFKLNKLNDPLVRK